MTRSGAQALDPPRALAALGGLAFVLASLVLGIRLLALATRTRRLPEVCIGLALLLMGGLGYPLIMTAPLGLIAAGSMWLAFLPPAAYLRRVRAWPSTPRRAERSRMLGSAAFAWTCAEIERGTPLSELVARGTVRLALEQAGLEPQSVSGDQMAIVLREILPRELAGRAVANATKRCSEIALRIRGRNFEGGDAVVDVFQRPGGGK